MTRRVIFLDHAGTPGGGQLSALRLLPLLQDIDPVALYLTGGPVSGQMREIGVETVVFDEEGTFSSRSLLTAARSVWKYLRGEDPSTPVVALSTAAAQVLALVPGRQPRLLRLSEDMERYRNRGLKSLAYFRLIFPRFDGFISNSRWTTSTIPESLRRIPVRLAYPLSGIRAVTPRATPILEDPTVHLACFSRSVRWKGIDLAIAAADALADRGAPVRLTIFGGGWQSEDDYAAELRSLAERSSASVRFAGHIDDVESAMADVDVVLLPSRLPEPFGQVTAQSLSAGCLTVVSAHGGSLELVEDQRTGFTFPSDDASALAAVLDRALQDPAGSRAIAEAGQRSAVGLTDGPLSRDFEGAIIALLDAPRE